MTQLSPDVSVDETLDLRDYLARFGARLVKSQGTVFASVSGTLTLPGASIPYALVPSQGTLAKQGKWNKLSPAARLALAQQRINPDTLSAIERELRDFVEHARRLAEKRLVDPHRFLGGLQAPTELASRRFQVIEARIEAAGVKSREQTNAALTKASVSLSLYPESFPVASRLKRRFIAVLGPTNSGKTHQAIQALSQARNGVYLAPLRLLALENYERLTEAGVAVSLVTGEERRLLPGATHVASTIEMLNFRDPVKIAVIDEIQMLDDPDRGSAWTAAVCGVPAEEVYLVGSLSARAAIEALVGRLGCELEIHVLERKSPLVVEPHPVQHLRHLKKGDALIAFSRRDVLAWRDQLQAAGLSVAVIYGSLSPEVRRAQAKRFRDGEVDVLVATDAVGMGLNLPIRRIIFTTSTKFDGVDECTLPAWLAQQIGGRAGRFGLHEEGYVAGWDEKTHRVIRQLLARPLEPQPVRGFPVAPSLDQLDQISQATGERRLEGLLTLFTRHTDVHDEFFLPADLQEQKERSQWLDALPLSLEHRFLLASVPLSTKVKVLRDAWEGWSRAIAVGKKSRVTLERLSGTAAALLELEDLCKKYSAYAWLAYRLPDLFPDGEAAMDLARQTSMQIDALLQAQNARARSGRAMLADLCVAAKGTGERRGKR